ncbi:MAG TPA: hypothetical protein H9918_02300 [Candidatus Ligilactobacillus faecavium]|uniref:Uncharacterized protein n=1 Tax=Candidatus Ligilactobacillus excrementigallinarum TaxID=2838641 RepID=A0A9D1UXB2_9LACO|nr:hypothetical protein [Candidatus Ligilactobacillus excrementigallinarum]HJD08610.1 hypothetical protein [Candidatus Ligilactobacillus faecavium]
MSNKLIWRPFSLGNEKYFNLHSTSSGIDKKNIVQNNGKKIAYVTRTDKNNGIDSFVSIQAKNYDKGNVISIGLDT